jgi:lipopolysaccharide assembly outer membrane protein LptD (OstA)
VRGFGILGAALFLPGVALAQVPERRVPVRSDTGVTAPGRPAADTVRGDTTRRRAARGDTTGVDSAAAQRELVQWAEPDSVMNALLNRPGYTATRYQGKRAAFNATQRTLTLSGQGAVQREQTILVADTIVYNDSTKIVRAAAPPQDTIVLRDPSQGTSDLVALGGMEYDIVHRRGIARELSTSSAQAGQTWYVATDKGAVQGDTSGRGHSTSYAEDGSITSCDRPLPHYHFQAKEIKIVSKRLLVARPAVLYIADIPVMWLPFIFQDMRPGRHSGLIAPRIGISDIVRTSSGYTRQIDNLGYYFALNDYMDATVTFDWRSGNSDREGDVGWRRFNGEWRYRWLDRFLSGAIRTSYSTFSDGQTSLGLSWSHQQQFSQHSSLNANLNYSSNTTAIRQQAFTVAQALATIASAINFQQTLGPASFSVGGTRTQYTGRKEVDQNFPNLSVNVKPISITPWLLWSPQLSVNNTQSFNMEAAPVRYIPSSTGPGFDTVRVKADQRTTTVSLQTPLRIFGFTWQNSIRVNEHEEDFPRAYQILDFETGRPIGTRVFGQTFDTRIDWETGISLPVLLQGTFNLTPTVSIVNADPSYPFMARTTFSGGRYVRQTKTLQYGVSIAPTLFGFFPGFGPFTRIRHSIQPRLQYGYAPAADVRDDFLQAYNKTRAGYPGGLPRSTLTFQLDQVFEAKLRSRNDTNPEGGEKIKLLTLGFSAITYDFERARRTNLSGFTTPSFSYHVTSDLLPGFDLTVDYSLYQGDIQSDTARFKPFRTGIDASLTLGRNNNPFAVLRRIFGGKQTDTSTAAAAANTTSAQGINQQPNVAGPMTGRYPNEINTAGGWSATFNFSSHRSRPIPGARIFDPTSFCRQFLNDPFTYQRCLTQNQNTPIDSLEQRFGGGEVIVPPPQTTLRSSVAFNLTPKWAMQWTTGYDFERHEFSDQNVSLQRDMHDWRALLSFSRAPNGNFAFNFFISLKAEPDLKFDYSRSTYRPPSGSTTP